VPEYVGDVPLIFVLIRVAHLVGVMNGVLPSQSSSNDSESRPQQTKELPILQDRHAS
jgi:hypothetical protein